MNSAFRPDSILRRGLLLLAMPLALQVTVIGVLFLNEGASRRAELLALHSQRVISHAQAVMLVEFEEVSRLRGLIITENPALSTPASMNVVAEMEEVCALVGDDPEQSRRAQALLASLRKIDNLKVTAEALLKAGKFAEVAEGVRTLRGERLLRTALTQLQAFLAAEEQLSTERLELLQRTRGFQRSLLAGALLAAAAATLLQARAFARGFSSRLAVVTANARRISENIPLAPLLEGKDEIAELDRTLHYAAEQLAEAAEAERHYEEDLVERAEALVLANQDLTYKSREIETFVYSVSHDLRSPLVNLQGFCREIELSCEGLWRVLEPVALPPQVRGELVTVEHGLREAVHFIRASVTSSGKLIDALLRLSRAGRVRYQWQVIDVAEVVHRLLDVLRMSIQQKGAEVSVGDLPQARGDLVAVEQIFGNLLSNAVNYLDPSRPGRIEVGAESGPPGSPVTYWVRDNGIGIPVPFQGALFKAFQRFHGNDVSGEGIGLALVRRAVERHGGDVGVESSEGVGSRFLFTLPSPEQEVPERVPAPSFL